MGLPCPPLPPVAAALPAGSQMPAAPPMVAASPAAAWLPLSWLPLARLAPLAAALAGMPLGGVGPLAVREWLSLALAALSPEMGAEAACDASPPEGAALAPAAMSACGGPGGNARCLQGGGAHVGLPQHTAAPALCPGNVNGAPPLLS